MVSLDCSTHYYKWLTKTLIETSGRKDGLIDHRFFVTHNFLLTLSVAFVDGMLPYGVNAFFPVEASAIFTNDPVKVNIYLVSRQENAGNPFYTANNFIASVEEYFVYRWTGRFRLYPRQDSSLPHNAMRLSRSHLGVMWTSRLSDTVENSHDIGLHRLHWPRCQCHDSHPCCHLDILCDIISSVRFLTNHVSLNAY